MPRQPNRTAYKNRGLFYFRTHIDDKGNLGVINKCLGIVEAFQGYGIETDHYFFSKDGLVKNRSEQFSVGFSTIKNSFGHFLLFLFVGGRRLMKLIDFNDYDFIYIRHLPTNFVFIRRLKRIKKRYPHLKILVEIPTFPYDEEYNSFAAKLILGIDRYYRKKLHNLIDLILVDVPETEVFGVPALYIPIGLSKDRLKDWNTAPQKVIDETIELVFIGNISFWHGIDRVIKGIKAYQTDPQSKTYPVRFTIIGSGTELPRLKRLIEKEGLAEHILCKEPIPFLELKKILDKAHIGIGTLGAHRKGLSECSSIKHRDYFGMGLPIVFSGLDPDFQDLGKMTFKVPEDDSEIPILEMVNWYRDTRKDVGFDKGITQFAAKKLMWSQKLKPLKNYLYPS